MGSYISCCPAVSVPTVQFSHDSKCPPYNRVHSAVRSQSLARIKESSHWKESRACCATMFCVLSTMLFFKRQEAICLQTKSIASSPSLPPCYLARLKYLSGLFLICPCRLNHIAKLFGLVCIGLFKECQPQGANSFTCSVTLQLSASELLPTDNRDKKK